MKTNKQLKNDILAELRCEPSVNAEQIGVEVKDGIVTLAVEMDVKLPRSRWPTTRNSAWAALYLPRTWAAGCESPAG